MSLEHLALTLLVGLISGWLAGKIVKGAGLGLIGDIVVGVTGAFVGGWILPRLDIHLGVGLVSQTINATVGAILLLLLIRLVRRL
jgi:uncharacterized membrane protein YeaQ/YmgE (transglycosylase-associated protein family)